LGYSGYRELSREIKRYINQQLALRFHKVTPEAEGLAGKVSVMADELSDRVLNMKADAGQIAQVAELLYNAKRVFITSTTEGQGLATLWSTYLSLLDIEAHAVQADPARAAIMLRTLTKDDVLLAISLGLGPGAEVGHFLSAAQAKGVHTISVTTSPTLLPARQANTNLVAPSKTPQGYPSFDTLMAMLSILWQALMSLNEEKAHNGIKKTVDTLNDLVDQRDKVPSYDIAALLRLWGQT
jgi:DNA-binding MurR/RpiR family transcriptional regulator